MSLNLSQAQAVHWATSPVFLGRSIHVLSSIEPSVQAPFLSAQFQSHRNREFCRRGANSQGRAHARCAYVRHCRRLHPQRSSSSECSCYGGFSSSEAESSQHRRLRPIRSSVAAATATAGVRGARAHAGEEEGRRQHLRQAEGPPQAARHVTRRVPQHNLQRQARAVGVAWG